MQHKPLYPVVAGVAAVALLFVVRHYSQRLPVEQPGAHRDEHVGRPETGPVLGLAEVEYRAPAELAYEPSAERQATTTRDEVSLEEPLRVQILNKALRHSESMPQRSAMDKARAANILLTVCVTTILDARGDYIEVFPGTESGITVPAGSHCLFSGERRYDFRVDQFPEFSEIVEIIKGRGETVDDIDPNAVGTDLDEMLKVQIQLRYEEALALARSMHD